ESTLPRYFLSHEVAGCVIGITRADALARHHRQLQAKYNEAASRPWDSIAADPPEPSEGDTRPRCVAEYLRLAAGLDCLHLEDFHCRDDDLAPLKDRRDLSHLLLESCPITDAGLAHLEHLTSLKFLDLSNTRITDAGLVRLENLKRLQSLVLDGTAIT